MATRAQKYHQAAVAYLVYGLLYLGGALYVAAAGASERALGRGTGWFILGALLVLGLPPLIWKGFKWVTRLLAVLVLLRVFGLVRVVLEDAGGVVPLPWGPALPGTYAAGVFLVIAAVTGFMLARAGWDWKRRGPGDSPQ